MTWTNTTLAITAAAFATIGALTAVVTAQPVPDDAGGAATNDKSMIAEGGNANGFDMAPETRLEVVESAVATIPLKIPDGPVKPTWDSLQENYKVPQWFYEAKFGIFMHWGLYSVPAYHNEWYEKHMYKSFTKWHTDNFGPPEKFGYKDFIPMFTAAKWDPDAWADLFKKAGAKFVMPTAQHHDNFALWDSDVTPFNAKKMGPKRDLIGDLAKAVRAKGLKFGVSNHGVENFQFINATEATLADLKAKKADLFDPEWAAFYNVADRSDEACRKFLVDWALRNAELINKYQPDILWFDNGVDIRYMDPLKLWLAAYYYNSAKIQGKEVSISTKKAAYAPAGTNVKTIGSIIDFEKVGGRSPAGIRTGAWQVDDPIGSTWGYTKEMKVSAPASILGKLIDTVAKGGTYLLNISPMADGTIPQAQQDTLLAIGEWLQINGEAIYGTHAWTKFGEPAARGQPGLNVRFTVKGDDLYAIILGDWPGADATIKSLATGAAPEGKITEVTMLGHSGKLQFTQTADGLQVKLPNSAPGKLAYTLKISGLKMNPTTWTTSGNPQ
ncbi:MAG: alpha-L-fucosidase [Burkholderiales bacterium]|nr:alpha-L-fucosidase [Phycisphaerae bacterium]